MLTDEMDIFTCAPHNDLLSNREPNEAYCLARSGREYAVYFPNGGDVFLDIQGLRQPVTVRWLDILKSTWQRPEVVQGGSKLELRCPSRGYWVILVQ